jgi:hypothetical protein
VQFRVNNAAHQWSAQRRSMLSNSNAIREIAAAALPQLLLGLFAAFLSQYFNHSLSSFYDALGWKKADEGVYGTLLGGIASIGAVFIGLYYAGITAVGVAKYSSLPSGIRNMLVSEVFGSAYMRFLALLTFYSLSLLCLHALGYAQVQIAIPVLMLLSGIGIVGFMDSHGKIVTFRRFVLKETICDVRGYFCRLSIDMDTTVATTILCSRQSVH